MNDYLKYNLHSHLQKDKNKYNLFVYITCLLFIILMIITIIFNTYNVITINAQTICGENEECILTFYWQANKTLKYDFFKIEDKEVEIETINFEEITLDNFNNAYQKITLKVKERKGKNNEIIKLKIFQSKEKIIKKIGKIIVEREI